MIRSFIGRIPVLRFRRNVLRSTAARHTCYQAQLLTVHVTEQWAPIWGGWRSRRYFCSQLPTHVRITLPALSPTMESGTIVSWEKKEGERLNEGDLLAEIETDKATMGFETPEEGYLAKILVPAGTKDVPIGKLVCIIVQEQDHVAAFKDFKDDGKVAAAPRPAPSPAAPSTVPIAPPSPSVPSTPSLPQEVAPSANAAAAPSERVYASPMARRLAEQRNIRLQGKGTGLYDSITAADVSAMSATHPTMIGSPTMSTPAAAGPIPTGSATGTYSDLPLTNIRSTIAKRLVAAKQTIPHYYLSAELNMDRLLTLRSKFNSQLERTHNTKPSGTPKLSVNDFVIKAVAMASMQVPEANSWWMDTFIRQFNQVDVSVAVSTERGLITPIVFRADSMGLMRISDTVKALAKKARDGKLQPQEFQGGTISISNLGMYGVNHFSAIINPPQCCILAVGATTTRLVRDGKDSFKESNFMTVTLSCDHRVVDGAVGAQWLRAFKRMIEEPEAMLL